MKRIIIFFIAILFSGNVMAGWTQIIHDTPQGEKIFVDKESISKDGNLAVIWSLIDYEAPQSSGGKNQLSTKSLDEYDCQSKEHRTLNFFWYSGHMGKGKIVYSELVPGEMEAIIPNSAIEEIWNITCDKEGA